MALRLAIIFCLASSSLFATHLRSGEINITHVSGNDYTITLTVYTNSRSAVLFSDANGGILDFGDQSPIHHPPEQQGTMLRPDVSIVVYRINHTYPTSGTFIVSYLEPNYNQGILNFANSVTTPFKLVSSFTADPAHSYSSPEFAVQGAFVFPEGPLSLSVATPDNSKRTYYALSTPAGVTEYKIPSDAAVDANTGLLTWDGKFNDQLVAGEFVFCIHILVFADDDTLLGWCDRIIDVILDDNGSEIAIESPLEKDSSIVVLVNKSKDFKFVLGDISTGAALAWQLNADSTVLPNLSLTEYDSTANGFSYRIGVLNVHTTENIVRKNPYIVSLRGLNNKSNVYAVRDINVLYYTEHPDIPDGITGLEPAETLTFTAYPTPFNSQLFFDGVHPGAHVFFRNVLGQIAFDDFVQDGLPLNTSWLTPGFYILDVIDNHKIGRIKVVKE